MTQLSKVDVLSLPFVVILISILLTLPLTVILTLAVIRTFRRWVKRSMEATADKHYQANAAGNVEMSEVVERPVPDRVAEELQIKQIDLAGEQTGVASATPLVAAVRRRERRLALIFGLAACAHPLILAGLITIKSYKSSGQHEIFAMLLIYSSYFLLTATPVALAATMILTKQLRFLIASVLATMAALLVLDWAVHSSNLITLWLMLSGLPTAVVLLLNTRRFKAVGSIVFAATLLFICLSVAGQVYGAFFMWNVIGPVQFVPEDLARLPLDTAAEQYAKEVLRAPSEAIGVLVSDPSRIIRAAHPERLTTRYELLWGGLSLLSIVLGVVAGWAFVRWLAFRYQTRRSSDQLLTIDVLMAVFTLTGVLLYFSTFGLTGAACVLAGFGGYKLLAHWLLRPPIGLTSTKGGLTLLLLRVFRSNRTGQPLLQKVMHRWRYLGPARLIAGTDFADSIIEPHEFFEFLSRRLSRAFVKNRQDLENRLSIQEPRPDPGGLYRIEDFFCHRDTWQMAVAYLAKQANAVLMDLRGFSSANRGCTFEIEMLLSSVPVNRILFLVDNSTDRVCLENTFQFAWSTLPCTSPNAGAGQHQLSLLQASGDRSAVDSLLGLLCAKARESQ